MNIQLPSLHTTSREPVASRPLPEASASAHDPAGFASLLRQTQAAPQPMQTAPPPPHRAVSAPSEVHDARASTAAAPAPPATQPAAHEQGPDADPMDKPNLADGTPTTAPQGRPRPAAPGKPRPEGPTGVAQRDADVAGSATPERDTTAAGKAGLELLPPLPPLHLPALATDTLPGPTPATWPAALPAAQRGTPASDASAPPITAGGAARLNPGAMPDTAAGPSPQSPPGLPGAPSSPSSANSASAPSAPSAPDLKTDAVSMRPSADKAAANEAPVAAEAATNGRLFAPALTAQAVDTTPPQAAVARSADAGIAIGMSFVPNPEPGARTAPAVAVALATPVTAPEFAQELGLRMSVLAQGGVQHAELHLNPADMGPVSVQIVIDGSQAQVEFGADVAATRAAIEAGLPALASALQDAGFTLTGGGVSQHARGRGDGNSGNEGGSAAPRTRRIHGMAVDAATHAAGATRQRTVTLGGLDLYA